MNHYQRFERNLVLALLFLTLTACGGGGGGSTGGGTTTPPATNTAPVAAAGSDQSVIAGDTVYLSGAASQDADGDSLSYSWQFNSIPAGSSAQLSTANAPTSSFIADIPGNYIIALIVNDGKTNSQADTVTVTAAPLNHPPIANAGVDSSVLVGNSVTLSATGSSDPDGDSLNYSWSFSSKPQGSSATLSDPTAISPAFTPDIAGIYEVSLQVNDGLLSSVADSVRITATIPNRQPIANAGPDSTVTIGDTVTLSGVQSNDPDGDSLSYSWQLASQPEGGEATLSNANTASATFVPNVPGSYVATLIVSDGQLSSEADSVTVIANLPNRAPIANAGPDAQSSVGATVTLSGLLSSDPDDDPLSYNWQFESRPTGSNATLNNATQLAPSFVPDLVGNYIITLVVNDGQLSSASDSVTIAVAAQATIPTANAGPDSTAQTGQTVTLTGQNSTPINGGTLSYNWQFQNKPDDSSSTLSNADTVSPSFVPDAPGYYVIALTVKEGQLTSATDTVTINVNLANHQPIADAGANITAKVDTLVTLSGAASSDPDGDTLSYQWQISTRPENSVAELQNPAAVSPTLLVDQIGNFVISLIVNDGSQNSQSDSVTITVTPENTAPVANAGADQILNVGATATLSGIESSDIDGDPLSYQWQFSARPQGSNATLSDSSAVSPSFVVDLPGSYVVSLIVNDGQLDSEADSVTVSTPSANSAPTANAGDDQTASVGQTIQLDGSGSSDPDGDNLSFQWQFTNKPNGSNAGLRESNSESASFIADVSGSYTMQLTVSDGQYSSADSVTITATSGTITQGTAITTLSNLFSAGSRVAALGSFSQSAVSGASWTVPAKVNYQNTAVPFASDLHNIYVPGHDYSSAESALAALDGSDIIEIDAAGEVFTAYIFADNYFEMYVNGTAVGKDAVPYTDFNSSIIRFRVSQPFNVAMLLVDWEENLGTGTEANNGEANHPGDGGMVAVFKDSSGNIVGVSDSSWKAQTYYTAPINDLSCLSESDYQRLSTQCSTSAPSSLSDVFAVHWTLPNNWAATNFDDSNWPAAATYSNTTVGVSNKPSYTNFADVFDASGNDAQFIWSSNLILDNKVLVRGTVGNRNFSVSSKSIKTDQILPLDATCDGVDKGHMLALDWDAAPAASQSYAITMINYPNPSDAGDLSKAHGYIVLYDIPATTTSLTRGQTDVGVFGINSIDGERGFSAPCSKDPISNNYFVTVYALSNPPGSLNLDTNTADLVAVTNAIADTTLETARLNLTRVRYNPNNDDHLPTDVATECSSKSQAFAPYSDWVSVSCDSTTMTVTSKTQMPYRSELDGDKLNVGIQSWIGRVPVPEQSQWKLPLQPSYLTSPTSNINIHHPIGISVDGVPILHYAKEASADEIAQLGTDYSDRDTALLGEIDQCGGHAGNGEDYHYHTAPLCLMDSHDPAQPLAYMFDGLPLYFGTGGGVLTEQGTDYGAGRYAALDYRPSKVKTGERPLDECNAFDLNGDGSEYVYYSSATAPYTIGCFRGQADQANAVSNGPHWQQERDLAWSGSDVSLTDASTIIFEGADWRYIEITPNVGNNNIPANKKALILYRQLKVNDSGYDSNANCYRFRYRLDSSDTEGSQDTVATHCR